MKIFAMVYQLHKNTQRNMILDSPSKKFQK